MIRSFLTAALLFLANVVHADSFTSESDGHVLILEIQNPHDQTILNTKIEVLETSPFINITGVDPARIPMMGADETREVRITFDIGKIDEENAEGRIQLLLKAEEGFFENPTPEATFPVEGERIAECNSAVGAGNDAPETITVDLGEFTGKAGFSWEMYGIKDQMDVTVGGESKTTGCVSGSGTVEFNITSPGSTASVSVLPNCEGTSGTAWNFTLECPLESNVTADGQGNAIDPDSTSEGDTGSTPTAGLPGQLTPQTPIPTAAGQPVTPAALPPTVIGPTGARDNESEANNEHASATPISLGGTVVGTIGERGDRDHYLVSVPHQGELTVAFPQVPAEVNIAFRVLDAMGSQIWGWQGAPNDGEAFSGWADLSASGAYVIEVRDGSSNAFSATPYTMTTRFIPSADTGEPNNTYDSAKPLGWNQAIRANILPRGDADHYKVSANRMGQLTVAFPTAPPEVNIAYQVLDASGSQIWGWSGATNNGEPYSSTADLPAPGDYIIEVRDGSSNARSAVPYEMVASLDPAFDPGEPNDDPASATPTPFDTQVWANILPRGDSDLYEIQIAQQGELTVDFNASPLNLNMAFRVLNVDGSQVWGWQGASNNGELYSNWADLKAPGTYIVEVRDGSSNDRSHQPYGMVMSFLPTADPAEPNDVHTDATPLVFGTPMQSNILPRGDSDNFAIQIAQQGELTVDFSQSPDNLNMAFRVLSETGTQVWGWQGAAQNGEPYRNWADLKDPGSYVIEVRDGSSNDRSPAPYTLNATFLPTPDPAEPNDTPDTATPLSLGQTQAASILPRGDADHYVLDIPSRGQLNVNLPASVPDLNMAFRVLDAGGNQVWGWQGATDAGESFQGWADLTGPGRYVVEVRDGSSNARSATPYEVITTLDAVADNSFEPNDTIGQATPIGMNKTVNGTILPRGDADLYAISVSGTDIDVTITSSPPNLNMAFRVLDASGSQVWGWQGASEEGELYTGTATLASPGRYMLEFRDGSSNDRSAEAYGFVVSNR